MSDTMILSVPRSGLHYIRFCAELFSGRMTPRGKNTKPMLVSDASKGFVFHRSHWSWTKEEEEEFFWYKFYEKDGEYAHDRLILVIRNYKESFVRTYKQSWYGMRDYIHNTIEYDAFPGEKMIAYYEDFVRTPAAMTQIMKFLRVSVPDDVDWDAIGKRSREFYHQMARCHTIENPMDFLFHSRKLSQARRERIDEMMRSRYPSLFEKYWKRYSE